MRKIGQVGLFGSASRYGRFRPKSPLSRADAASCVEDVGGLEMCVGVGKGLRRVFSEGQKMSKWYFLPQIGVLKMLGEDELLGEL